jgi:hypothetical protein
MARKVWSSAKRKRRLGRARKKEQEVMGDRERARAPSPAVLTKSRLVEVMVPLEG